MKQMGTPFTNTRDKGSDDTTWVPSSAISGGARAGTGMVWWPMGWRKWPPMSIITGLSTHIPMFCLGGSRRRAPIGVKFTKIWSECSPLFMLSWITTSSTLSENNLTTRPSQGGAHVGRNRWFGGESSFCKAEEAMKHKFRSLKQVGRTIWC